MVDGFGHPIRLAVDRAAGAWQVSTAQNPQARVHRSPSSMKVAVPSFQHS